MTETVEASLTADETLDAASQGIDHVIGGSGFVFYYSLLGALLGIAVAALFSPFVTYLLWMSGSPAAGVLEVPVNAAVAVVLALWGRDIGARLAMHRHRCKFLAGMRDRGMPEEITGRFTVTNDAFVISHDRVTYAIAWNAVGEVIEIPTHWLFAVDLHQFTLPRSAFADIAEERTFIASVLGHLTESARERSDKARAFAEG